MPRSIPIALAEHLSQPATTTTLICKITPVTPGFSAYGVTLLDRDVPYDNGTGLVVYRALIGMVPSALIGYSDLTTDQAASDHLFPEFDIPELSEDAIRAGAYDLAEYELMLVNYEDPAQGHITLKEGTIGRVTVKADGLSFINEMRDLSARLKQSICEKDSIPCRALFGSQKVGSITPGPQVSHGWCGFDATTLWAATDVAEVGAESTLTFRVDDATGWAVNHLVPGLVKFTSGANSGRSFEIAGNTADGWITLAIETDYPVATADDLEYRPNCSQLARDEAKGCKFWFGPDWIHHFRGEPDMPIGDEGAMFTPGAGVGPGSGGTTNLPLDVDA